jgi:hypothetical protein
MSGQYYRSFRVSGAFPGVYHKSRKRKIASEASNFTRSVNKEYHEELGSINVSS